MTKLTPPTGLALWERALASEFGIALKTNNKRTLSNALYTIRAEAKRPDLADLVITLPKRPEDEIWICHKEVKLED